MHYGEVGILLGISNLFKKSRPDAAGVLSGLGEALSRDDIADKGEWFKFKKKEENIDSKIPPIDQESKAKGIGKNAK